MTNGEKIKEIFPDAEITIVKSNYERTKVAIDWKFEQIPSYYNLFYEDWWNAEYKEPTTRSDCAKQNGCITCSLDEGDDCCRKLFEESMQEPMVTPQESVKCKWIKYDYRTMCPKEHDVNSPYWRIPENRMETLLYCPYCGKEIEIEE